MIITISLAFLLLLNMLNIAADVSNEEGYCDISTKVCNHDVESTDNNLIFYDVNPSEGFNLRRDVYMRFAIMVAEAKKRGKKKKWQLVLPPWYRLYHWKLERNPYPIFWGEFFDVESLKKFAPVAEIYEVFPKSKKKLEIDVLYVLQNFDDPFEGGTFVDKWEESDEECFYDSGFWGYSNITAKEIVCVKYQGHISKLWEIISLHPNHKNVMFAHGETPLHDSYGTKSYWDCRKSMKFNNELNDKANKFLLEHFGCDSVKCMNYISVHWRRQDFARGRIKYVPSVTGTVKQIDSAIKKNTPKIKNIFIASDATEFELKELETGLNNFGYKVYFYIPSKIELKKYKDGGLAIIEQIICSHSAYFIGTHESTFTFRIQEEREILGFESSTTFNRLCPDTGICEKPSKWTIVK